MDVNSLFFLFKYTPWWVWVVFGYLMFIGISAMFHNIVFIPRLFLLPASLLLINIWSANFFFYAVVLVLSGFAGWYVAARSAITVLKKEWSVQVPGTYVTFALLMLLFCEKYFMGFMKAVHPFAVRKFLLADLLITAAIAGYFLGRALYLAYRWYRHAQE